jgi:hypothetical protein
MEREWRNRSWSAANIVKLKLLISRHISLTLALAVFALGVFGQKNLDVCRVTTHKRSISEGYGTGIYEIGKFPVDDFDDGEEKTYVYETDGRKYDVKAEVEYGDFRDVEKGKPTRIILSIAAKVADEKDKTKLALPVEAEGTYRYRFGTISVSMDVVTGDIAQSFQLTCSDGISKGSVQRGEPKWLKKARANKDN